MDHLVEPSYSWNKRRDRQIISSLLLLLLLLLLREKHIHGYSVSVIVAVTTNGVGRQLDKHFSAPHVDVLRLENHGSGGEMSLGLEGFHGDDSTGIEDRGRCELSSSVLMKGGDTTPSKRRRDNEFVKRQWASSTQKMVHSSHHGAMWHGVNYLSHRPLVEWEVRKLVEVRFRFGGAWLTGTFTLDHETFDAVRKEALAAKKTLMVVSPLVATCKA